MLYACDGCPKSPKKMVFHVLQCKFQHVQYFALDIRISQRFIILFSNGLQYFDGDLISINVICYSKFSVKYF